ncbi:GFA family protein [Aliiroseovarius crassostreae]|uniref:GFA family protein n=1 Tax=Aliiroseovarius crassostreae TaxID=154981 RepID=UPI003C7CCB72
MSQFKGGCLCGACRFEYHGDVRFSIQCYCRDCQHATGAGHAPQMVVDRSRLRTEGPFKTYHSKAASGHALAFTFCAECGSPLVKSTTRMPDAIAIYAGALDDPSIYTRGNDVFEDRRHDWDS